MRKDDLLGFLLIILVLAMVVFIAMFIGGSGEMDRGFRILFILGTGASGYVIGRIVEEL